ncbi:MAG: type IX secretion system membrane protein PorP/SprF [Cyclobacteriaceae bacterium]|nr:type IX secretion system membrane protein PorP/SprF [Cyclobacteriaceae bacterium]
MFKLKFSATCLFVFTVWLARAQDISNFTQFFFNPYLLNPSFAGIEGKPAVFLAYRNQWSGIEGSPTIANLSFHKPVKQNMGFGMSATNDQRGVLSNTGLLFSYAYSVPIEEGMFVRFGLSVGGSWNTIDLQKLQAFSSDPALMNALNQNASIIGNAGISAHLKSFHFSIAMPNLFSPSYVSPDAFTLTELQPFKALIFQASNRFYFGQDKYVFEPYAIYRLNSGLPSQYEFAGVFHLNHMIWAGGSYKQEFGISAFGGIRINNSLAAGGSYTLKNTGDNSLNFPSFEVHLSYHVVPKTNSRVRGKQPVLPVYSFLDTEKPKVKKPAGPTPAQLAAEKKRQEELAKKKAEEQRLAEAAKAEEERKAAEALAIKHAEEERAAAVLLDEHKADVVEHVNDSIHPVDPNERHETVERGDHAQELHVNNYVIAGVFGSPANAKKFAQGLIDLGFDAEFGHLTVKNLWYVHVFQHADINVTRSARDEFRKFKILQNAWLLTVQDLQ